MFDSTLNASEVQQAIQLALTPVFLLLAIGNLLGVLTGRFARLIARARKLTEDPKYLEPERIQETQEEPQNLEIRRRLVSLSIIIGTVSALMVCMAIATLFLRVFVRVEVGFVVGVEFLVATITFVFSLIYSLREVQLSNSLIRIPALHSEPDGEDQQ
jgi:MFS family permease